MPVLVPKPVLVPVVRGVRSEASWGSVGPIVMGGVVSRASIVRRFRTYTYKQRSILILLPLMLLAISTWALNESVSPWLDEQRRSVLYLSARIFFPGLFAIAVAFVIPTFDRCFQISTVTIIYVVALLIVPTYRSDLLLNPIICVLAAISSILAMLPYPVRLDENIINRTRRMFLVICSIVVLPTITVLGILLILRQMHIYILYTFDGTFGTSVLSVIYVPLYLVLQTLGFHDFVGELVTLRCNDSMATAFVNAIVVSNLFSLPAILFTRSLFTKGHVRLVLTMLVAIAILTNSIGACVSLILLWFMIFYPGSFAALLGTSMVCFTFSLLLQAPALTSVGNLYMPDISLNTVRLLLKDQALTALEGFSVFIPVVLVLFSMWISRERSQDRRRKWRSINIGYSINASSTPELKVIAFLRALGGISNVVDVAEDGSWLYIQVASREAVSVSSLNSLLSDKVLIDRLNKLYLCEVGEQSHFLHQRLSKLIANPFGESEYEMQLSTPFDIRPMDYEHRSGRTTTFGGVATADDGVAATAPEEGVVTTTSDGTSAETVFISAAAAAAAAAETAAQAEQDAAADSRKSEEVAAASSS